MRTSRPPGVVLLALAGDVLLVGISLHNALFGAPFHKFGVLFDVDAESNLPTWYSSMQLFVVSLMLGLAALRGFVRSSFQSWLFLMLPAMFLLFSVDEVAMIHDWLGHKLDTLSPLFDRRGTAFALTGFWGVAIGIPCLIAAVGLVLSARRLFPTSPRAYRKVLLGSIIFISAAAGVDAVQNVVAPATPLYVITTHAEEFLELLGSTLVLWGAWDLLISLNCAIYLDRREPVRPGEHGARNLD